MRNCWLGGIAVAALAVAGVAAAQAADLPTRKEAPAPIFVPPPFTWTGFYVGANIGGVWGTGNSQATLYAAGFPILTNVNNGSLGTGASGVIGGGQAGYNWQTGAFVLGVETDFDGTSLSKTRSVIGPAFNYAGLSDHFTTEATASLDWLGTTRLRAGMVVTPDNRLLVYGTGGLAYGGGSAHLNNFDDFEGWGWNGGKSDSRVGWTIGAGVEYAITNNITLKGEYLYYNLGTTNEVAIPSSVASAAFPGASLAGKVTYEGSIFRVGANYKF